MEIYYQHHPQDFMTMNTSEIRQNFLLDSLMKNNQVKLIYSHYDRVVIGGIVPTHELLSLPTPDDLKAAYFLERREMGIINVGGKGKISAGAASYTLQKLDGIYLGRGEKNIRFESFDENNPALFFLISANAHQNYPTQVIPFAQVQGLQLGSQEFVNRRTIYKYIHPEGVQSCQLVMGLTILEGSNVWNTMPPHTHDRRMETYFYFDLPENQSILHLMGQPEETRHVWVQNHQAIISPPWSVHAGCGTTNYGFIWGMAGENQSFSDMDMVSIETLK